MIRVAIVDDHAIVREGLRSVLGQSSDMQIVGEAADAEGAYKLCKEAAPDIMVIDVTIPGPGILETIYQIRNLHEGLRLLVYSVHQERNYAKRVLKAGADGYLNKGRPPKELLLAIRQISNGKKYIPPSLAQELAFELTRPGDGAPHEQLSNREYEVLLKLGSGTSVNTIADLLNLSPKTVRTYRSRILQKMAIDSTAELIFYVLHNNLLADDVPIRLPKGITGRSRNGARRNRR
jgi:two-component system invasion response regulator UvrY